ncbi:MAG: type I-G CRISPR-associated protein Csb2 [Solirubrobacteraceae bacterium]
MPAALLISVRFTADAYRGGDLGRPEDLPSPARLHAAFVAAAAGGPEAGVEGAVLVAADRDRDAVAWLESTEPLGVVAPPTRLTTYAARRHRVRAAVDPKERHEHHREETAFEPLSALAAPMIYAWPPAEQEVRDRLAALAQEITHVGCADSTVVVRVSDGEFDPGDSGALVIAAGRGPGRELRVPEPGRLAALVRAHQRALAPGPHRHGAGTKGKQAPDQPVATANEDATRLRRFAPQRPEGPWPYAETWTVPVTPSLPRWSTRPEQRVPTAVLVHRALVAAIGDDVPSFVTGREGDGPLVGAGHLAVQFAAREEGASPALVLGVPAGVPEADLAALLSALGRGPAVRVGGQVLRLGPPDVEPALSFWPAAAYTFATEVPVVLDAPGTPRHGPWTLDSAALCSLGYALRGVLEAQGFGWGVGWSFRQELVAELRRRGAAARAMRVPRDAARFAHRGREGDLLVAVHAAVKLGDLTSGGRGLLALGRARHLGGGLIRPLETR